MSSGQAESSVVPWKLIGLPRFGDIVQPGQAEVPGSADDYVEQSMAEAFGQPIDVTETGYFDAEQIAEMAEATAETESDESLRADDFGAAHTSVAERVDGPDSPVLLDPEAATHQDLVWANQQLSEDMAQLLSTVRSLGSVWGRDLANAQSRYATLINHQTELAEQRVACKERIDGDGTDENPGTKKIAEDAKTAHDQAEVQFGEDTATYRAPLDEMIDATIAIRETDPNVEEVGAITVQFDKLAISAIELATGVALSPEWLSELRQKALSDGSDTKTFYQRAKARAASHAEEQKRQEALRAANATHQNELDALEVIRQGEYQASFDVLAASKQVRRRERAARRAIRVSNGGAVRIWLRKAGVYLGFTTDETNSNETIGVTNEEEIQ